MIIRFEKGILIESFIRLELLKIERKMIWVNFYYEFEIYNSLF